MWKCVETLFPTWEYCLPHNAKDAIGCDPTWMFPGASSPCITMIHLTSIYLLHSSPIVSHHLPNDLPSSPLYLSRSFSIFDARMYTYMCTYTRIYTCIYIYTKTVLLCMSMIYIYIYILYIYIYIYSRI